MKIGISAILLFLLSFPTLQASALSVTPTQPIPVSSGLLITAYGVSATQSSLDVLQLYNSNETVISLDGWQVSIVTTLQPIPQPIMTLSGYMKAESHVLYSKNGSVTGPGVYPFTLPGFAVGEKITKVVLLAPTTELSGAEQPIATTDGVYRRGTTTTGYSTSTTFTKLSEPISLYADEFYVIPAAPALQIVEVVARHAECAPNDTSVVCGDYLKLRNNGEVAIDTSWYRLRTDSGTSESGNAFSLGGFLAPGAYLTVSMRDDGEKLSLTDSGGYAWLEDAAGLVKYYDETMAQYPSASSSSKIGWAWVLDPADNTWKWTSTPQPDTDNLVTIPVTTVVAEGVSECPAGKYRSPDTNRCRTIEEAVNVLAQCEEGKERNPVTNRCRSVASLASAPLMPCDEGQERNPATNRCRSVLAVSQTLAPCQTGYKRNPETNRCKKTLAGSAPATTPAAALESGGGSTLTTALIITTALGAAGYGVYEWRSELLRALRHIASVGRK
jgi:hypothetical protein